MRGLERAVEREREERGREEEMEGERESPLARSGTCWRQVACMCGTLISHNVFID